MCLGVTVYMYTMTFSSMITMISFFLEINIEKKWNKMLENQLSPFWECTPEITGFAKIHAFRHFLVNFFSKNGLLKPFYGTKGVPEKSPSLGIRPISTFCGGPKVQKF